jgi:heme exporter protein B
MHASLYRAIESVFRKEARISLRSRSSWLVVLMFALTTLSCVSLLMQGDILAPRLAASMLWIILFFSLLAGAGRGFADEEQAGTLMALQVYGSSQAVLFGKGLFMAVLLFVLSLLIVPMYLVLMDIAVASWPAFLLTLLGGTYGMAMAGTALGLDVRRESAERTALHPDAARAAAHPAAGHRADRLVLCGRGGTWLVSRRHRALRCHHDTGRFSAL